MNEIILKAFRMMSRSKHDPIHDEPTPQQLGIRRQVVQSEQDYRLLLQRAKYGFRTVHPNGSRDYTVVY